jgi:hypothetical protein
MRSIARSFHFRVVFMRSQRFGRSGALAVVFALVGAKLSVSAPTTPTSSEIARVDLAAPFKARTPWVLVATQGPPTIDDLGDPVPGAVQLCFKEGPEGSCASPSPMPPPVDDAAGGRWEAHYLPVAKVVFPGGREAAPLLLIVTGSLYSGDGDQARATQLFRYNRDSDSFERVYARTTGKNNNQEVRFMASGPLQGAVISAEPTEHAPYGYWISVDRFTPPHGYRQVLRYRSATRYNDGNSLAVIDSEMANLERRLALWRPGSPLPLPMEGARACPRPHLKREELWCE